MKPGLGLWLIFMLRELSGSANSSGSNDREDEYILNDSVNFILYESTGCKSMSWEA